MTRVHRGFGQSAESRYNLLALKRTEFSQRFSANHLSQLRSTGDGGNTAADPEVRIDDTAVGYLYAHPQDVPAGGIVHLNVRIGVGQFTNPICILKLFQHPMGVHKKGSLFKVAGLVNR